jgi:hypothetical protein
MMKTITMFMIITILIVGCGAETGADTESAKWKTFSNDQYGYSFEVPAFCFEGPLPGECKQSPPEERAEECLCFVDGTNPDSVMFQNITITSEGFPMASVSIMSPDTPAYSPPEGSDLVIFVQQEFGEMYPAEISTEPNMELDGVAALRITVAGSPGVGDYQDIFFIKENKLVKITLMDTLIENNMNIYEQILSTFNFNE